MTDNNNSTVVPVVPASENLPELTAPVIILAVVLSVVLGAANAYLGLFAGMTVSASIPAAVIAMASLRAFKGNILQNNAVQTAASAGESLAAGVIFTIPALILMGAWQKFHYLETTLIASFGGVLGVLFTIPLRRALIIGSDLKFPEGVATAEVLKVTEKSDGDDQASGGVALILLGALMGALFKFGASGVKLWHESAGAASKVGGTVLYTGSALSPALIAVGFIVRLNIATVVVIGGLINWYIAIPILAAMQEAGPKSPEALANSLMDSASSQGPANTMAGIFSPTGVSTLTHNPEPPALNYAFGLWSNETRFLGVGAMLVGGLWAVIKLRKPLVDGLKASFAAYKTKEADDVPRTEKDTPMAYVLAGCALMLIPLFVLFYYFTDRALISVMMSFFVVLFGFLFSAVAAYMAGLVGSSNNPISGVTICTILISSLLLFIMKMDATAGPVAAILIGGVVCCAAALGGDNMQDLKAGQLVGSTPWKQQLMQLLGVLAAAAVLAPILNMLHEAYVIGSPQLSAPQGTLMRFVAEGPYKGLPWAMVMVGAVVAILAIVLDRTLERTKASFRVPALALAVGIYLPLELTVPIFIGGLLHHAIFKRGGSEQRGVLMSAGIITGEALVGILLAIPIAVTNEKELLSLADYSWLQSIWSIIDPQLIGIAVLVFIGAIFYRMAMKSDNPLD